MTCTRCGSSARPVHEMGDDMRLRLQCGRCGAPAEEPAPATAPPAARAPAARPAPAGPIDIVSTIRARLAEVESQIRDVRALEAEAELLRRMLAVADNVTPLRAAG